MLKVDGHDDAIIGVGESFSRQPILVYSVESIVKNLMERDGMTDEEAIEFFDFNIIGSYIGEGMPIFVTPYDTYDLSN